MSPLSRASAKELACIAGVAALAGMAMLVGSVLFAWIPRQDESDTDGPVPNIVVAALCLCFSFACIIMLVKKGVTRESSP